MTRRALARAAIDAEPWCHRPGCGHADAGAPGNELMVDLPRHLEEFDGDLEAWRSQPLRPVCHLCACVERRRLARAAC
ncbi:MAG: hypothetical protein HYX34_14410 [Actinobacteria bacterium]|nr:hypothetical protein [Actinomycetota bacterium]